MPATLDLQLGVKLRNLKEMVAAEDGIIMKDFERPVNMARRLGELPVSRLV